jgi:wyosine [tRNA(Phe)-imidazoG37] synthetase (radical SAM superfamily)
VPLRHERAAYVQPDEILAEVELALSTHRKTGIEWVTFVGSGEPLLNQDLGTMIRGVKETTNIPVAVITNGSLLSLKEVREELRPADAVLPTLDAGTPALFRRINRPHPAISFRTHLEGLIEFRKEFPGSLLLELMLVRGLNDSEEALREIARCVEEISPDEVHISLPERPPAEPWIRPADEEGLVRASAILGDVARVLHPGESILVLTDADGALDSILQVIRRHPLRGDQLEGALSDHPPQLREEIMKKLRSSPEARPIRRYGSLFWVSPQASFPDDPQPENRP